VGPQRLKADTRRVWFDFEYVPSESNVALLQSPNKVLIGVTPLGPYGRGQVPHYRTDYCSRVSVTVDGQQSKDLQSQICSQANLASIVFGDLDDVFGSVRILMELPLTNGKSAVIDIHPQDRSFREFRSACDRVFPRPESANGRPTPDQFSPDPSKAVLSVAGSFRPRLLFGSYWLLRNDPATAFKNGGVQIPPGVNLDAFITESCKRDYLKTCISITKALDTDGASKVFADSIDGTATFAEVPVGKYFLIAVGKTLDQKYVARHQEVELRPGRNLIGFTAY
jgi:hypothetical protein